MKKVLASVLVLALALSAVFAFASCGKNDSDPTDSASPSSKDKLVIAVPNDTTNEARALMLLDSLGVIKLKEGAGITATVSDIEENPNNIKFNEVEAAQLPNVLKDVDYAVINSNYAIEAGINPSKDALASEGSASARISPSPPSVTAVLSVCKTPSSFRRCSISGNVSCSLLAP